MPGVSTSPSAAELGPASVFVVLELPPVAEPPLAASGSPVLEPGVAGGAPEEVTLPLPAPAEGPAPDAPALAAVELPAAATLPAELPEAEPPPLETAPDVPAFPQAHNRSAAAEDARRLRAIAEVGDRVTPRVRG
jgi:hypothetical protein